MRHASCALALVVAGTVGCGGSDGGMLSAQSTGGGTPVSNPTGSTTPGGGTVATTYVITISNMTFSPLNLHARPGATITVENRDAMPHSVTSEVLVGAYTPGAPNGITPFDTGVFSLAQRTFTVPANATAGTVIPYYCTVHRQLMATPNGTITVDPNAQPTTSTVTPGMSPTTTSTPSTSMPMPVFGAGY